MRNNKIQNVAATAGVIFFFLLLGVVGRLDNEGISFLHGAVLSTVYLLGLGVCSRLYVHFNKAGSKVSNRVVYRSRQKRVYAPRVHGDIAA